jgi:hypothetical protein
MQRTFATPGHVVAVVENAAGAVDIACQAVTTTEVILDASSPAGLERIEQAVVECTPSADDQLVSVRVPYQHGRARFRRCDVRVRIVVPLRSDVDVSTASAPIAVRGLTGHATFKTASGAIVADDAEGIVRAKSASGDIALGSIDGEVRAQSVAGDVHVTRATRRLSVSTISGRIEVDAADDELEARTTSGRIVLGALRGDASATTVSGGVTIAALRRGRLQIRTVSGDVTVGIAEKVTLRVDVDSVSGRVRSEIPITDQPSADEAAPIVSVAGRTVSGDVTLQRAAEPALAE